MAPYRVEIKRSALKELAGLHPREGSRLLDAVETLAADPRPRQCKKLKGSESTYRIRMGDYRVIYQVDDGDRTVTVYRIGHHREVYR